MKGKSTNVTKLAIASILAGSISAIPQTAAASSFQYFKLLGSGGEIRNSIFQDSSVVYGAEHSKSEKDAGEGKCGEGKCGDDKKPVATPNAEKGKEAESKCGEGKCGQ